MKYVLIGILILAVLEFLFTAPAWILSGLLIIICCAFMAELEHEEQEEISRN